MFTEERHSINTEKRLAQPVRGAGAGAAVVPGGLDPQEAPGALGKQLPVEQGPQDPEPQ